MRKKILNKSFALLTIVVTCIVSCGGGSSYDNTNRPELGSLTPSPSVGTLSPILDDTNVQIFGSTDTMAGDAIGFSIIPSSSANIDSVMWSQTSGPALTFLAPHSQTIGFDVPSAGSYSLQVEVSLQNSAQTQTYDINFSASADASNAVQERVNVRLDHSVSELGKVSLHIGIPSNKSIASVSWQQLAGPQVDAIESDEDYLFFDAPAVDKDDVIAYRANVNFTDGSAASDDVLITVNNIDIDENGLFYNSNTIISDDLFVANNNSPFKMAVEDCVYSNAIPNIPRCTLSELPLIGTTSNSNTPSVEQILDRTLVSHPWMAERFKYYLENSIAGEDMRNLLRGVTAIVISYDVRPSFYWAATGAIYLDANNFWQSPDERDTLNDAPDYRANFGSELRFQVLWRYTKDNAYYPNRSYPKQERSERSFDDVEASISWLMYHELAHANDFFPSTTWATISANISPLTYYNQNGTNSDILDIRYPLRSNEMHALAQVRFRNEPATSVQKNYDGDDIATFFTPDIAPSFYAYLTIREDFATMFERYMMLFRLDSEADVAISDSQSADDYGVSWGQRNRISDVALADRAVFVVNRVYPELQDVRTSLTNLPEPILMDNNKGWFENIGISPASTVSAESRQGKRQEIDRQKQFLLDSSHNMHRNKPDIPN